MFGLLIGSFLFGILSDKYGRRKALLSGAILSGGISLAMSFIKNYWAYFVLRVLLGIFSKSLFMLAFMICVEISGVDYKTYLGILIQVSSRFVPLFSTLWSIEHCDLKHQFRNGFRVFLYFPHYSFYPTFCFLSRNFFVQFCILFCNLFFIPHSILYPTYFDIDDVIISFPHIVNYPAYAIFPIYYTLSGICIDLYPAYCWCCSPLLSRTPFLNPTFWFISRIYFEIITTFCSPSRTLFFVPHFAHFPAFYDLPRL